MRISPIRKLLFYLLILIVINNIFCQIREIEISEKITEFTEDNPSFNVYYKVSLSKSSSSTYKFIKIVSKPKNEDGKAYLYLSNKESSPSSINYDISAIENGENTIYIPRTYFETSYRNFFYLNTFVKMVVIIQYLFNK